MHLSYEFEIALIRFFYISKQVAKGLTLKMV